MRLKSNICLIGMPSSGKSTLGVLLAKALSMHFIDTDLLIQAMCGKSLSVIQRDEGMDAFLALEADVVSQLICERTVIATGGSAVYCSRSMEHLRSMAKVVYLDLPIVEIAQRIGNTVERGVVMQAGMALPDLCEQRRPLYENYAELTLSCGGRTHEELVDELKNKVKDFLNE